MKQNEANALSDTVEEIVNLENLAYSSAQRNCSIVSDPCGSSEIQLASYCILLLEVQITAIRWPLIAS